MREGPGRSPAGGAPGTAAAPAERARDAGGETAPVPFVDALLGSYLLIGAGAPLPVRPARRGHRERRHLPGDALAGRDRVEPRHGVPPSHVGVATAISLTLMRYRPRIGVPALLMTAALAVANVYGGFHYATDAWVGAAFGVAVAAGLAAARPASPKPSQAAVPAARPAEPAPRNPEHRGT